MHLKGWRDMRFIFITSDIARDEEVIKITNTDVKSAVVDLAKFHGYDYKVLAKIKDHITIEELVNFYNQHIATFGNKISEVYSVGEPIYGKWQN